MLWWFYDQHRATSSISPRWRWLVAICSGFLHDATSISHSCLAGHNVFTIIADYSSLYHLLTCNPRRPIFRSISSFNHEITCRIIFYHTFLGLKLFSAYFWSKSTKAVFHLNYFSTERIKNRKDVERQIRQLWSWSQDLRIVSGRPTELPWCDSSLYHQRGNYHGATAAAAVNVFFTNYLTVSSWRTAFDNSAGRCWTSAFQSVPSLISTFMQTTSFFQA